MITPSRHPRRAALAALALAVVSTGCQSAIASTTTTGTGPPMTAETVDPHLAAALGLGDVGQGPVSWWATASEVARPTGEVTPMGTFVPAGGIGITDVVHPNVTPTPVALTAAEIVLRPAWSTRVDTESSSAPMALGVAEEVTISFATPGTPGQFPDDANREVLEVATNVTVAAGSCEDVVSLQVWQVGPPQVEAAEGAVQADYLGSLLLRADCA